ncbi:MAG: DUF4235 domain-containing protein [Thermoleophilaceae bacterium]
MRIATLAGIAKLVFIPFSILGGMVAGFIGKKVFEQVWGLIDEEEPPESEHRLASWPKLIAAAALEGAIFRATRVAADHGTRKAFAGMTGSWPGSEEPEPE